MLYLQSTIAHKNKNTMNKKEAFLNFKVTKEFKAEFKSYAAKNSIAMNKLLELLFMEEKKKKTIVKGLKE